MCIKLFEAEPEFPLNQTFPSVVIESLDQLLEPAPRLKSLSLTKFSMNPTIKISLLSTKLSVSADTVTLIELAPEFIVLQSN